TTDSSIWRQPRQCRCNGSRPGWRCRMVLRTGMSTTQRADLLQALQATLVRAMPTLRIPYPSQHMMAMPQHRAARGEHVPPMNQLQTTSTIKFCYRPLEGSWLLRVIQWYEVVADRAIANRTGERPPSERCGRWW